MSTSIQALPAQTADIDPVAFFDAILPSTGLRCMAIPQKTREGRRYHKHFFGDSNAWLAEATQRADATRSLNVFYGCASFRDTSSREQANVEAVRSFWLDLDVGDDPPKKFPTQRAAVEALAAFCAKLGLPMPWVVKSGGGVHCYWPTTEDMRPAVWTATAKLLKAACKAEGFKADASRTADCASILRPPGTHHRKGEPKPVRIVHVGEAMELEKFQQALLPYSMGVEDEPTDALGPAPAHAGLASNDDLTGGIEHRPSSAARAAEKCGVMGYVRDSRGNVDQPTWYYTLGVMAFTTDGSELAHGWSNGHPHYSRAETEAKLSQWQMVGHPTTCAKLSECQPDVCAACPYAGSVKTPWTLGTYDNDNVVELAEQAAQTDGEWLAPRPIHSTLLPVPAYDINFLPGPLQQVVSEEACSVPTPVELVGSAVSAACGAIIGNRIGVNFKRDAAWVETPVVWYMGVGNPSVSKTPSFRLARNGLREVDEFYDTQHQSAVAQYQSDQLIYEANLQAYKAALKKGQTPPPHPGQEPAQPRRRITYTSNTTPEAAGELCLSNPTGIEIYCDELSGFISDMNQEKNRGARAFYLEGFAAQNPYRTTRIGRGEIYVPKLAITVAGHIQPGPLQALLVNQARGGAQADGLLQRFGMVVYPDVSPHHDLVDVRTDPAAELAAMRAISSLATYDAAGHGARPVKGCDAVFGLDDAALAVFKDWYRWMRREVGDDLRPSPYRDHVNKLPRVVANIALLIHIMEGFRGDITGFTMERAVAAAHFYAAHALRVYSLAQDASVEPARQIAARISKGDIGDEIGSREIYRQGWAGCRTAEEAEAALDLLEDHGWVRAVEARATPLGGRPAKRWRISPAAQGSPYK